MSTGGPVTDLAGEDAAAMPAGVARDMGRAGRGVLARAA